LETKILAASIRSRDAWERVDNLVGGNLNAEFSPEVCFVLTKVKEYYTADKDAKKVDTDILLGTVEREIPSAKQVERIKAVVVGLPEDVSTINVLKELNAIKRHSVGLKLSALLATGKDPEMVSTLMEEFLALKAADTQDETQEEVFESVPVESLIKEHFSSDKCIELWPKALNDAVDGQAKPGHHILVFAPTEMGKSLIVINMTAGFVAQKKKVLYIGNEDPAADLYMRYLTRMTRMNKYEIQENPDKAQRLLDARDYGLLVLKPLAPGNFYEIRKLVEQHKPDIVILDQLRNLDVRSDGRTQQLEKAATEARNLAKSRRLLVVSVTQAGDSATGKAVLGRGDVDGSNVGIPGQVDLMLGIGANEVDEANNIRTFSFPKNKLSGKHEAFKVQIDPLTSRVVE